MEMRGKLLEEEVHFTIILVGISNRNTSEKKKRIRKHGWIIHSVKDKFRHLRASQILGAALQRD